MAFKKGDKIVCIDANKRLELGKVYTVKIANAFIVYLEEGAGGWYNWRFQLAVELAKPVVKARFKAGDVVRCIRDEGFMLDIGNEYVLAQDEYKDGLDDMVDLKAPAGKRDADWRGFYANRFELVKAFELQPKPVEAGDWVVCANNVNVQLIHGRKYLVKRVHPNGKYLINGLLYNANRFEAIKLVAPVKEAIIPAAPKAKAPEAKPAPVVIPRQVAIPDLIEEMGKKQPTGQLANYSFQFANGAISFNPNTACHAAIGYAGRYLPKAEGQELIAFGYSIRNDATHISKADKPIWREYVEYIITRSPFAVCFTSKDPDKDLLMNVECNRHQLAAACVSLRMAHEYAGRINTWKFLKDQGIDEGIAWLFGCCYKFNGNTYIHGRWDGGHDVINYNKDVLSCLKFFRDGFHTPEGTLKDPFRKSHDKAYVIGNAVARVGNKSIRRWMDETCEAKCGDGWDANVQITPEKLTEAAKKLEALMKEMK